MKRKDLSEDEQKTLLCIINNPNMMMSNLSRRMHSMSITDKDDRQLIIDTLEADLKLIESKPEAFSLGKRGRRAKVFNATESGKNLIKKIISSNKKSR